MHDALTAERDAIAKRIETAPPLQHEELERQFGQRLAHLESQIAEAAKAADAIAAAKARSEAKAAAKAAAKSPAKPAH